MRFPVSIGLRRSYFLVCSVCIMHGAAAGAFLFLPWPLPTRIALLIALTVSLGYALRPSRVIALRLHANGALECVLSNGTCLPVIPLPDTAVFTWLVVLRLKAEDQKGTISLPLLPDHMTREEFRVLRLWLRWGVNPDIPS
ncbi:MAG: hypothetical protein LBU43_10495 [Candidatus Accumulibacter sp.]|nr:hypothetical protein [Accumulibacter sp.]